MKNVVSPGILSISTYLEKCRRMPTKSAGFSDDEREGHCGAHCEKKCEVVSVT